MDEWADVEVKSVPAVCSEEREQRKSHPGLFVLSLRTKQRTSLTDDPLSGPGEDGPNGRDRERRAEIDEDRVGPW